MYSDDVYKHRCNVIQYNLPEDVKRRYFPEQTQLEGFDILPLFGVKEYNKKLMKSLSILENPSFAKKWQDFKEQLPYIARNHKIVTFKSKDTGRAFVNYRKQKVPLDFATRFIAKPSPQAIFHTKS